jgi:hypothetical protein
VAAQLPRKGNQRMTVAIPIERLPVERFARFFTIGDGCWEWQGPTTSSGYGYVICKRRKAMAHRAIYELIHGPVEGLLHHTCRNKACVNPSHLTTTTRRAHPTLHAQERTHCRNGHAYAEHGELWSGVRKCRICRLARQRRYDHKRNGRQA